MAGAEGARMTRPAPHASAARSPGAKLAPDPIVTGPYLVSEVPTAATTSGHASGHGPRVQTGSENVAVTEQALNTVDKTLLSVPGINLAETFAVPFQNASSGIREMIALTDSNTQVWSPTRFDYACTNSTSSMYSTWCPKSLPVTNQGGDVSAIYRSVPNPRSVYVAKLLLDNNGFQKGVRLLWTSEPCAILCQPVTWSFCDYNLTSFDGSNVNLVDFPHLMYNENNDQIWMSYLYLDPTTLLRGIYISRFIDQGGGCPAFDIPDFDGYVNGDVGQVNGDFDSNGDINLVFWDRTHGNIKHQKYFPTLNYYSSTITTLGSATNPTGTCTTCPGRPTYTTLDASCLRHSPHPTIAVGRTSDPNTLVVTYSTKGSGAHVEGRFYQSNDGGATWFFRAQTTGQTTIKMRVASAHEAGFVDTQGLFHAVSEYASSTQTQVSTVDWKSTNFGTNWSGTFISAARSTPGPINPASCYWGDFLGIAADRSFSSFFFDWENGSGTNWVLRGAAQNQ
jgi:hypothetical protein